MTSWAINEGDRVVSRSVGTGKRLGRLSELSRIVLDDSDDKDLSEEMAVNALISVLIQARRLGLGPISANKIAGAINVHGEKSHDWIWGLIRRELAEFKIARGERLLYEISDEQWKEWRFKVYWRGQFTSVTALHQKYCPTSNLSTLHRRITVLGWPSQLAMLMPKEHHGRKKAVVK